MKKLLALILALVMVLGLVACGKADAPAADAPAADAPAADAPAADAPAADAPAADAVVGDRNGDGVVRVGFANIAETVYQHTAIKEGMEAAAAERGWELVYMNNALDGQKAVANATQMVQMDIDWMIEYNADISVANVVMDIMNEADIPVLAVDIEHEGAIYFGADNYGVGPIHGRYAANLVKEEWGGEIDAMLIVEAPTSGENVLARTDLIVDGYRELLDLPDEKIFKVDGGADSAEAQKVTADFLTAHPDMHKILVCPAHVVFRTGASAAIDIAERQTDCLMVSQGEYDYLDYIAANPEAPEWEVYRGTVAYAFMYYGKYCFEILDKWAAGEEMEASYVPEHFMVDRSNVYDLYGSYFDAQG